MYGAGPRAAYVEQGAGGWRTGTGAGELQDADRVGGPGEPGGLVGQIGQGDGGQIAVPGLVGGVDGGLPVALGIRVPVGVEAQPGGAVREVGGHGVEPAADRRGVAVLGDEVDGGVQVGVDETGDVRVRS
jgi:hypothetical protein